MSQMKRLRPLAGIVAMGLAAPAMAGEPSKPFPAYEVGPQTNGTIVVSTGQIITPAGVQVPLGNNVRAKAIALNPKSTSNTAAVLTMGAAEPVIVFDTVTGAVLQNYLPFQDSSGSYSGIAYSADGKYLIFSQDDGNVTIASVGANGLLTDYAQVPVAGSNEFIKCFHLPTGIPAGFKSAYGAPVSLSNAGPVGNGHPCGTFYNGATSTSPGPAYPGGVSFSSNGKSAYVLLNDNDTVASIDLKQNPPVLTKQIRVGNAPHSILINNNLAYISNEGGRAATATDFQMYSSGTPIVADPRTGASTTGTVSVVNLASFNAKSVINIPVGLHPTGMATFGHYLLVANAQSDSISVIDMDANMVTRTIDLGLPVKAPGQSAPAFGGTPVSIAVNSSAGVAYVALYHANAIAVVDLSGATSNPVMGLIPTAFAPASVVFDAVNDQLAVANDKGIGARYSFGSAVGVTGYNTHQDNATVSLIPLAHLSTSLAAMTTQVMQNNHWDLAATIGAAGKPNPNAAPVAIPKHIGEPSLIKHVFLIVRENRTYDQILGDVAKGNGDPELAVYGGQDTPNAHALVTRFPLLDNFYDPSRQSADGHNWIVQSMAPYQDDIQSPDWVRSYPGNGGDALVYTPKGLLFQEVPAAGLSMKLYGEYADYSFWSYKAQGAATYSEPSWSELYADAQAYEAGTETSLALQPYLFTFTSIPGIAPYVVTNFPVFDTNIPDQWRVDAWKQDFDKDVAAGTVPALSVLWIMNDHTGGPPTGDAEQADNDLAVGRVIDYVSHSNVWASSAIFIEEDDSQSGVDHVDGHRSPGYVVSPYVVQNGPADHTFYTQVNMTRTIEQILGVPPLNQFDLVASPMTTLFVNGTPPAANFAPWDHVPNQVPLDQGVASNEPANELEKAWGEARKQIFAGKMTKPDAEDAYTVNHMNWYFATRFKKPYPGESTVRHPSEFAERIARPVLDLDD